MRSKIITVFTGLAGLWVILALRAGYLQFLPHDRLNALQARQFQTAVTLPARRGNILDMNGKELAMSAPAYSIYADPKMIENKKQMARILNQATGESFHSIYNKIKDSRKRFVWIDRLVSTTAAESLKEKKYKGLGFVEEWKRVYPNDNLLSTTLGFMGKEAQGLEGLELFYDKELKGENKKVTLRKDARGRLLVQDGTVFTEPPQGKDLKLTIDSDLQYFLETEMFQALNKYEAEAAYAVILDAKTSAIRAMASLPNFDLNSPQKSNLQSRRNRSVTDAFEPGSTLKTFILAESLEKKIFTPNSKIFCENGRFKIGKRIIKEAEKDHSQGLITLSEVLAYSSNIGTSKVALKLGDQALREALVKFGFGQKSGIDMPGEVRGVVQPLPWRDHLLANVSFGQGVMVTPLQMANAYAAIANGGVLNKPYIVDSIIDHDSNTVNQIAPQKIQRVLSEEAAQQMRLMLAGVTMGKGTGVTAQVPGYIVGGKTGTAQKVNAKGKGYSGGGYIASFAGFIPANDPQYVIYIAVDQPKKGYYGAQVAAPLFASVASYAVRKQGLAPEIIAEKTVTKVPQAQSEDTRPDSEIYSQQDLNDEKQILTAAPDLKNLTIKEVLQKVNSQDIKVKFVGQGKVDQTWPEAGQALPQERQMTVFLK